MEIIVRLLLCQTKYLIISYKLSLWHYIGIHVYTNTNHGETYGGEA